MYPFGISTAPTSPFNLFNDFRVLISWMKYHVQESPKGRSNYVAAAKALIHAASLYPALAIWSSMYGFAPS